MAEIGFTVTSESDPGRFEHIKSYIFDVPYALIRLVHVDATIIRPSYAALLSGRPTRRRCAHSVETLQRGLDDRWKTGVPDRQERGSGVVGDVEGGRASHRERFD